MEKVSCQGNQGEGKKEAREAGSENTRGCVTEQGVASCSVMGGVFTEPSEEESQNHSHPLTPGLGGWSLWETAGGCHCLCGPRQPVNRPLLVSGGVVME